MSSIVADPAAIRQAAASYLALGWTPIPLMPPQTGDKAAGKRPQAADKATWFELWERADLWAPGRPEQIAFNGDAWQFLRLKLESIPVAFAGGCNVGVALDEASRGLVDVDLDCPEARELADEVLPPTWTFGRASAPRSHRLYLSPGAVTTQCKDTAGQMMVELRSTPESNRGQGIGGLQTVLPPSVHRTGEAIGWTDDCDSSELPTEIDPAELLQRVRVLACMTLIARTVGMPAAREFMTSRTLPEVPAAVGAKLREWLGVPPLASPRPLPPPRASADGRRPWQEVQDELRRMGPHAVALALGLESDERTGLRLCPSCGADTRGSTDKRSAAGYISARDGSGVTKWAHGKCGAIGDAWDLAAFSLVGTSRPSGKLFGEFMRKLAEKGLA